MIAVGSLSVWKDQTDQLRIINLLRTTREKPKSKVYFGGTVA